MSLQMHSKLFFQCMCNHSISLYDIAVYLRHQDPRVAGAGAALQGGGELELRLVAGAARREEELCQLPHEELLGQGTPVHVIIHLLHEPLVQVASDKMSRSHTLTLTHSHK